MVLCAVILQVIVSHSTGRIQEVYDRVYNSGTQTQQIRNKGLAHSKLSRVSTKRLEFSHSHFWKIQFYNATHTAQKAVYGCVGWQLSLYKRVIRIHTHWSAAWKAQTTNMPLHAIGTHIMQACVKRESAPNVGVASAVERNDNVMNSFIYT